MATFIIEGARVTSIATLYDELNRVFMADEDWTLGQSLDALDDLLYGGYGALQGAHDARVVWRDAELSRVALGRDATEAWLRGKLAHPEQFNAPTLRDQLAALLRGEGPTYFGHVLDVFAGHANITLVLDDDPDRAAHSADG